MELKVEISEALEIQSNQGTKRDNSGNQVSRDVLMYKWKWVVGKKKAIEGELCFFSEEDCKVDASFNQPPGEKNSLLIEKVWGPPPAKCKHMQQVFCICFVNVLKKLLNKNVKDVRSILILRKITWVFPAV